MPADTTSANLLLTLQADGNNSNTWGQINNSNLSFLEDAVTERETISTTGGSTVLTAAQNRSLGLFVSGTLSSNATITAYDKKHCFVVENATSGSYTVTVEPSGGTGVVVPQGGWAIVFMDGAGAADLMSMGGEYDANGAKVILDADADTYWQSSSDDAPVLTVGGAAALTYAGINATAAGTLTVTGGIIGSAIGASSPSTGAFTTLSASGAFSLSGDQVQVTEGGTGSTTASGARTNLGLGSLATASTINNGDWSGTDLAVGNGGTGASTEYDAVKNLKIMEYVEKSTTYTALLADLGTFFRFSAAATLDLTAAATLGTGWWCIVMADGGNVTIDPNSTEQINGTTTVTVNDGDFAILTCNGTSFRAVVAVAPTGGSYQPLDAELSAIAGLTSVANSVPYFTGSGTASLATLSSYGRSLIDDADASAARTTLGLVIGTDVQAYSFNLVDLAALTATDGAFIVGNGTDWITESGSTARASLGLVIGTDVQAYDADLAAIGALAKTDGNFVVGNGSTWVAESGSTARTSLGLGSLATASTINDSNWSGTDLAVTNGGTGSSTASGARTNLGVAIGSDVQAYDALLASLAGQTTAANKIQGYSASDTAQLRDFIDDDSFATATSSNIASAESIKAYADAAAAANTPWTLIETITPTSGTSIECATFSAYDSIKLELVSLSHNAGTSQSFSMSVSDDGGSTYNTAITITDAVGAGVNLNGIVFIHMTNVAGSSKYVVPFTGNLGTPYTTVGSATTETGVTNRLRFQPSAGSFDNAGAEIRIYGQN